MPPYHAFVSAIDRSLAAMSPTPHGEALCVKTMRWNVSDQPIIHRCDPGVWLRALSVSRRVPYH